MFIYEIKWLSKMFKTLKCVDIFPNAVISIYNGLLSEQIYLETRVNMPV